MSVGRLAAAVILIGGLARLVGWPDRINHDVAMYLYMAEQLLGGAVPYVDIIDLNPPLIIYLSAIPALVSRLLHAPLALTMLVMTWLFAVWSIETSRRLVRRTLPGSSLSGVLAAVLAFCAAWVIEGNEFGQKEHLFALALVPFLILRACRTSNEAPAGPWSAACIGFTAGVLSCLKPYFLVTALAPEVYWLLRRRTLRDWRSPELLAFGVAGLMYGAHFLFLPEGMRTAFFDRWVPFIVAGYDAYNEPLVTMLSRVELWAPLLGAAAIVLGRRTLPGGRALAPAIAIALPVTIAMVVLQQKGWTHHSLPAYALLCVAAAVVAAAAIDRRSIGWSAGVLAPAVLIAVAIVAIRPDIVSRAGIPPDTPLARIVEAHSAPGDSVLILSTAVDPAFPMLLTLNRRQASRYMFAFPLPMIYSRVSGPAAEEEARFRAELEADIRTSQPKVIAVTNWCQACPEGFTLAGYLQQTGVLSGAMAGYREIAPVDDMRIFVIAPVSSP